MLSESLSEYSALMVMKNALNDDIKMKNFLRYDIDRYLKGRSNETKTEMPLYKVENQSYVHYGKGSVILYALQDYIGEKKLNSVLNDFLEKYKYKTPYPTTLDFLTVLEKQVPDSLNYLITDWFKEITLYDYRLNNATYNQKENGKYQVVMNVEAYKVKVDDKGSEVRIPLNDWVDIGIYADQEERNLQYCERVFFSEAHMEFIVETSFKPEIAAIDPKRLLIEKIVNNNVVRVEKLIE